MAFNFMKDWWSCAKLDEERGGCAVGLAFAIRGLKASRGTPPTPHRVSGDPSPTPSRVAAARGRGVVRLSGNEILVGGVSPAASALPCA